MNDLFLIAHKVRGEVAYDVASKMIVEGQLGRDETWWIIPTSGHRAYPFYSIPLKSLGTPSLFPLDVPEMPSDLRDHYEVMSFTKNLGRIPEINIEDLFK